MGLAVLAAPAAHAQLNFDLTLDSGIFTSGGNGTIVLDTDPGDGNYAVSTLNPHITFAYDGLTFTEADLFRPASAMGADFQRRRDASVSVCRDNGISAPLSFLITLMATATM